MDSKNQSLQGCSVTWVQWYGTQRWLQLCLCRSLSRARDVIPFVSKAFASAFDSAASSALLFRAFTDSKEVPIAKIESKGAADEACKQNVNEKDQLLQLRSKQGKSLDFYSADFNSLFLQAHLLHLRKSKNLLESTLM